MLSLLYVPIYIYIYIYILPGIIFFSVFPPFYPILVVFSLLSRPQADWLPPLKVCCFSQAVTKGGRRFMAAWREEEEDAAKHRQEKREATRLGKLQSHTEA